MTAAPPPKIPRALRASAIATLAFAAWQITWLPAPVHGGADGLVWEWGTILDVAITLTAGVLAWRGNRTACALLASYGVWRTGWALVAIGAVLTGTWEAFGGVAWVVSRVVTLPFAICWILGGVSVVRERSARLPAVPNDGVPAA